MDQIHTAEDNAAKAAQSYTEAIVNAFNAVGDVADRKVTISGTTLTATVQGNSAPYRNIFVFRCTI